MIKLLASYNDELAKVVLENAPYNSKYTSHLIQKEILHIISSKVKSYIREEIGDSKFCIIVDESRDEYLREQMAIILRFVDKKGCIQERFFDLVHVKDTMTITLGKAVCDVLSRYRLDVSNIRGQGYDGASNMRGEWNGLQALFLKDCPYAYYIHCFAHRLQLALVAASRDIYEAFNMHDICALVEKFYLVDFSEQEKTNLRFQLQHFILEAVSHLELNNLSTMSELCDALEKIGKANTYYLIDRIILIILTLPVSTATTERLFSAMKIIKTRLRNKMEDEFLADN